MQLLCEIQLKKGICTQFNAAISKLNVKQYSNAYVYESICNGWSKEKLFTNVFEKAYQKLFSIAWKIFTKL